MYVHVFFQWYVPIQRKVLRFFTCVFIDQLPETSSATYRSLTTPYCRGGLLITTDLQTGRGIQLHQNLGELYRIAHDDSWSTLGQIEHRKQSRSGEFAWMPQLERLTLYVPFNSFPTDRIAETIISRWQRTTWKRVELLFVNHCEGEVRRQLGHSVLVQV